MLRWIIILLAGVALAASVTPASAAEPETEAANAAVAYIRTLQNPDGGLPAFGEGSAPGSTIDAVFALVAVGEDPTGVTVDGNSPFDYLATQAEEYADDPGAAAKLALALLVAPPYSKLDLGDFGGTDVLAAMRVAFDVETGRYGLDLFDQSLFILASVEFFGGAAPPVPGLVDYLRSVQQDDGGWEFLPGDGSDSNVTAIALQALLAAGADPAGPAVSAGLGYLHEAQNTDGGFGFLPGEHSDANSTAIVVQALVAAGEDIDPGGPWAPGGSTPLDGLLAFQNPASGAFQFAGADSPFATYQAVPALMLAPFPHLGMRPFLPGPPPLSAPTGVSTVVLPRTGAGSSAALPSWWFVAAVVAAGSVALVASAAAGRRMR